MPGSGANMIVDAHMHVWNKIHGKIGNEIPVSPLSNGMIRIGEQDLLGMPPYLLDCAARAEYAISEFNAAGVDVGIVVQEFLDGEQNDYLCGVLAKYPGRFLIHGLPDFWNLDQIAQEASVLLSSNFCGLKLPAEHLQNKIRLDNSRLMPVWERMEETRHVLAIDLSEGADQVVELENILQRCPRLHVAVGHFGMVNRRGWPAQLQLARFQNVYLDMGGLVWLFRSEGCPFPGALQAIQTAKSEVGIEKLMWGSDWPRTMIDFTYRQSLDFVRYSDCLSDHDKALILGQNACRLYRLPEITSVLKPVRAITED